MNKTYDFMCLYNLSLIFSNLEVRFFSLSKTVLLLASVEIFGENGTLILKLKQVFQMG
jgi:hypothetical protein